MSRALQQLHSLKLLSMASKEERTAIINKSSRNLILALSEVIFNVLYGTVELTSDEILRLRRYHKTLYTIARKSTSIFKKKKLLKQKGGFLTTLLPPAIALLVSMFQ